MARKPVEPPEILYEFVDDGDARVIDDVFNFLFDHFLAQQERSEYVENCN